MRVYRIEDNDGWGPWARLHKVGGYIKCGHCDEPHKVHMGVRYACKTVADLKACFNPKELDTFKTAGLRIAVYDVPVLEHDWKTEFALARNSTGIVGIYSYPAQCTFKPEGAKLIERKDIE